jgi:TusA-related sulfurtransferase
MKPSIIIDAKGLFCPAPIIKVAEAIRNIDRGMVVEIISDDAAIQHDMPAWCKSTGHIIQSMNEAGGVYRYCIVKK